MKHEEFERLFDDRVKQSRAVLVEKAKEYARGEDRMHNFRVAAELQGRTVEQALWGMAVKHIVSVSDLVRGLGEKTADKAVWDEKLGDLLNYSFLLDALIQERFEGKSDERFPSVELDQDFKPYEPQVLSSPQPPIVTRNETIALYKAMKGE